VPEYEEIKRLSMKR